LTEFFKCLLNFLTYSVLSERFAENGTISRRNSQLKYGICKKQLNRGGQFRYTIFGGIWQSSLLVTRGYSRFSNAPRFLIGTQFALRLDAYRNNLTQKEDESE